MLCEAIGSTLSATEHHGCSVHTHDACRQLHPVAGIGLPEMVDSRLTDRVIFTINLIAFRVVLVTADELFHIAIERRRK